MARRTIVGAIVLSLALHVLALVVMSLAPAWPFPPHAPVPLAQLPPLVVPSLAGDAEAADRAATATAIEVRSAGDRDEVAAAPSAPTRAPNPDPAAGAAAMAGGAGAGAPARVTDRADAVTLAAQPYDASSGYRVQRIRTADERQSREQVRATPHPAVSPWLATRAGTGHARRQPTPAPARAATIDRPVEDANGRELRSPSTAEPPAPASTADAEGTARPWLPRDPAATDSAKPSEDVSDRVDAPLVSDVRTPDAIELTRPAAPGEGQASAGAGALGYAPEARGRAPVPTGMPDLPRGDLRVSSYQRQYDLYVSRVKQKVDPLWEFPRDLALRLEQGDLLVSFTIARDGRVKDLRLVKRSGFPTFDKNVLRAIKKAAPFDPLPASLGPELRVTAPFAGGSPAIR